MSTTKSILIFIILVLIGAGAYAWSGTRNDDAMMQGDAMADKMMDKDGDAMMEKDAMMDSSGGTMMDTDVGDAMMQKDAMGGDDVMMAKKGTYQAYSADKLALADNGDVVLFFRASWCPTCRTLDADIRSRLDAIPAGVTILDVNYDEATALKQKYGVTYQHTLVQVDAQGNQIAKWSGSPTLADVVARIQ